MSTSVACYGFGLIAAAILAILTDMTIYDRFGTTWAVVSGVALFVLFCSLESSEIF